MDKKANTKKIRKEKDVEMEESSWSRSNNSRKRRLNNKRSSRNKSSSNSSMEVDLPQPSKQYDANNDDVISERESEYINFSQSKKCGKLKNENVKIYKFEEEKTWSWFKINHAPQISDIHVEVDIEQEQEEDNEEIAQITDVIQLNESEKNLLIKSFYWANLTESEVLQKKLKDFIVVFY